MARSDVLSAESVGRREFLRLAASGLGASLAFQAAREALGATAPGGVVRETICRKIGDGEGGCANTIPRRPFGRSGELVSILGLSGYHLGLIEDEGEAVELTRAAASMGVTFLDAAWEWQGGRSEEIVGKALKGGRRDRIFLATKHRGQDKKTALARLDDSLRRLNADVVDLWQFQVDGDADPETIFAKDGGVEAAEEAKRRGKVRYVGFAAPMDPAVFRKMLAHDFPWDAVQTPVDLPDAQLRSFQAEILPTLLERGIALIGAKSMGEERIPETGPAPEERLRGAWSQPVATVVSGISTMERLRLEVEAARRFKPLTEEEKAALPKTG